jgi:outer membrane protein assembly factor BamB/subtilisin family serine protease
MPLSLRRFFLLILIVAGAVRSAQAAGAPGEPLTAKERSQGYREHFLLAKPRAADQGTIGQAEAREGIQVAREFTRMGHLRLIELDSTDTADAALKRLRDSGLYEYVETDRVLYAYGWPNDPSFTQQWSLDNTGQEGGVSGADIGAVSAWNTTTGSASVLVAIIDSGMRLTHSDLVGNLWTNPSPSSTGYTNDLHGIDATVSKTSTKSGDPTDSAGHGTHVAGTIGAVGNNGVGITGIAWSVHLMPLKFIRSDGTGSTSDNIACIDYAIAHGVMIINASYGSSTYSAAEYEAIGRARDAGIIFVAAAGNDHANNDATPSYPASYTLDNIVSVAATGRSDTLASFSNYGPGTVDLAAPGDDILSTYFSSDTSYLSMNGTSMATPHVVGALALLKARFPSDTYRQLINRLLRSVTPLTSLAGKVQTGGRLQVARALATTENRPFNDDFADRSPLTGANFRVRTSSTGARAESGEPAHGGGSGASLWWTWTAPANGQVAFDTSGSSFDTTLAVYTGSALNALASVASNDDAAAGQTSSRVSLQVTAGTTYQIAVDGKGGASGLVLLRLSVTPANDDFARAETITGSSVSVTASNFNATRETGEPVVASVGTGRTVWYKWVAPATGRYTLATYSTEMDGAIGIYTGASVSALTLVASNNNYTTTNINPVVSFNAAAGATYYFAVDSTSLGGSVGGSFTLTLSDAVWQYPADDEITSSPAVGADGTVYFGSRDGSVYAVNADGTRRWRAGTAGAIDLATPALGTDDTVYIGSTDGFLYAFNTANGARRWRFAATSPLFSSAAIATDGTIYFRDDTTLYALASGAAAATRKWSVSLSGSTYSSPAIAADGTVYVGATGGKFYAVTPDGSVKWTYTADQDIYTSPSIDRDGTIYFATLAGTMYALSSTGAKKWSWTAPSGKSITSSPAIATDGTITFGGYDKTVYALRKDGTLAWSLGLPDEIRASSPALGADGTIYIGAYDAKLYAISSGGTIQRTYPAALRLRSSPVIASGRLYFTSSDTNLYGFALAQGASTSGWPMFRQNAMRQSRATTSGITLLTVPVAQLVQPGEKLTLRVEASGAGPLTYQWKKDGVTITGATSATYTVAAATAADAGSYTVTITGPSGSVTTDPVSVRVEVANPGQLINLSVRTTAGSGGETLIVGFVVKGSANKTMLVRGVGPGLEQFGLTNVLKDPQLQLYSGTTTLAANDDWGQADVASDNNSLAAIARAVGAFPLTAGSKDAALVQSVAAGNYTAHVTSADGGTGIVLAEFYDAGAAGADSKVVNISARARVGSGANILIAGFVVSGNVPKTLLIRGVGPGLRQFQVSDVLADPKLDLYRGSTVVQSNDDWTSTSNAAELSATFTQVGAFSLADVSKDAALLVTLEPGTYTVQLKGVGDTQGVGLIEVYEVR